MTNAWDASNAQVAKPPFAKEQMPKKHFLQLPKEYLDLNSASTHTLRANSVSTLQAGEVGNVIIQGVQGRKGAPPATYTNVGNTMIGNAGAMLVAENNAVSAPSPAEDNAMRAEKENEIVQIATAKIEARLLESQQANTARMVESQQAFFTQMAAHFQSTMSEHAVQSRSKDESHSVEAGRMATEPRR